MESSTYLLIDDKNSPYAVFTGDCLFLGEVGRPDLAVKSGNITQGIIFLFFLLLFIYSKKNIEDLASSLYDSLHNKLMTLPDQVLVFPAHGAGRY